MKFSTSLLMLCLTGFSAGTQAWTISADFDSGPLGVKANLEDGFSGAAGLSVYSSEVVVTGQSAQLTIKEDSTGWGTWGGEFMFPDKLYRGDKIWYQVHAYFPEDFDHYSYGEGNRLKFLRIHTKSAANTNHGYVDFLIDMKGSTNPFKWIYEGENKWSNVGEPDDMIVKGRWESYQVQVTFDTVPLDFGGRAESRIWKNGVLLEHITDRKTMKENSDFSNRALLFTYWNGGAPKTQSMYVDEITITNEAPNWMDAQGNLLIKNKLSNPPARLRSIMIK